MKNIKISASLICANQENLLKDVRALKKVDYLHIDVMDGIFVPRLGMYPEQLKSIRKYFNKKINVHLMIESPDTYIDVFAKAGADIITIHFECNSNLESALKKIKKLNLKTGICLKLETPVNVLVPYLNLLDSVMLMSIKPGILGQTADKNIFNKINELRKLSSNINIEIDGGVTYETAEQMVKNGANILTCGTGILFNKKFGNLNTAIKKLRGYLNEL